MTAPIIDEPVRGTVPPPWFGALSGVERMQALANRRLPRPPFFRLFGIDAAHVGPGSATWTMPASDWFQIGNGELVFAALLETALTGTALTAVPAGVDVTPLNVSMHLFRPSRSQRGHLVARARVVNTSRFFIFTEAQLEDPDGRLLAHGASQAAIRQIEPPPPPPPQAVQPVDEASYATPDPLDRPAAFQLSSAEPWETEGGLAAMREAAAAGGFGPPGWLVGIDLRELDAGRVVATMPASSWFCRFSQDVAPGVMVYFASLCTSATVFSLAAPAQSLVNLETGVRLYQPAVTDGRPLRIEADGWRRGESLAEARLQITDADGALVAGGSSYGAMIASSSRQAKPTRQAKRTVLSLLFLDIVGSTAVLDKLGDARWRELLEQYRAAVRTEIRRCEGTEIDTAGDGFFARFESPARALECAKSSRDSVKRLGIDVRAGVHVGECEVEGRTVAGMAVHVAARIMDAAGAGEIFASGTVRDLSVGSALRFEDRGQRSLKGVPEAWHLYSLLA